MSQAHPIRAPSRPGGALPDDGVHAPHLRGALQHAEGLRERVALVGRGQGGPKNQKRGQKGLWARFPRACAQHTAGAILPDAQSPANSHRGRLAEPNERPALPGTPR